MPAATSIHLVKWSFPAFALILGLLWYKRRRVDRVDPGGTTDTLETRPDDPGRPRIIDLPKDAPSQKARADLYDSGIHIDESFPSNFSNRETSTEERSPTGARKVSESLDIPIGRSSQQILSFQPAQQLYLENDSSSVEFQFDCKAAESESDRLGGNVQLGSNPHISNFEMIAKSKAGSTLDASRCQNEEKLMKIFENCIEENEQRPRCDYRERSQSEDTADTATGEEFERLSIFGATEQREARRSFEENKAQARVLSERDSANHSPVSGVLDDSVTDEARSEGSTDSGKGGSINEHTKNVAVPVVYEFSVPQSAVGRLIGRQGSFLQSIRSKASVVIVVKRHPTSRDQKICSIEGSSEGIDIALDLIRQKFPEKKYPEITLEQISLVKIPEEVSWVPELMQLSLIEGVNNDVVVSHIIKPNRLFVQLPTHPTYPSLKILDANMTMLYNTVESPPVPEQLSKGNVVVAKWYDKWVRVSVENPDPRGERNLVRLVDHGGYWTFGNTELRKIRSDYLMLPFQAIEIFLANIQPKGGIWQEEAYSVAAQICSGIIGQAQIEGYINSNVYVNLYLNIQKHGVISLADELVARGYAEVVPLEAIVPEDIPIF